MIECPDCGGYNTAGTVEYDDNGELLYTEWRCGDCGAEWIEDSEDEPPGFSFEYRYTGNL